MTKYIFQIVICLFLFGCATLKVINTSHKIVPEWVYGSIAQGHFRGIAMDASNPKEGFAFAVDDVKAQISRAIGCELRDEYERKVIAYRGEIDKKIVADFKCTSSSLLEDVESNVKDTYWQEYREKTRYGKRYFYKYYVLVHYPQRKIDAMRRKTLQENQNRLKQMEKCLSFGEKEVSKGNFVEALQTYIYALFISDTLFRNRNMYVEKCINKIGNIINSLTIVMNSNYKERPSSERRVSVLVKIDEAPAKNVPVKFEIIEGEGKPDKIVYTDNKGIAISKVDMRSVRVDNRARAFIDLSDVLTVDSRLCGFNKPKEVNFIFSTLDKIANIESGSLSVEKKGWLLNKKLFFKFDLKETHGLGVTFNWYEVRLNATYENKPWFREREIWSNSLEGSFNLNDAIRIPGGGIVQNEIEWSQWFYEALRTLAKKKYFKRVNFVFTLRGKDDNDNPQEIRLESIDFDKDFFAWFY
ncbi:MAG TPA: hypothetical protein DHV62_07150 [Elusimicrobia bacterium]|jgi:hypothetical protein|nr:hypothetical protein [Elusimicrobiota bacterium]